MSVANGLHQHKIARATLLENKKARLVPAHGSVFYSIFDVESWMLDVLLTKS
jgi:hypothetical protein